MASLTTLILWYPFVSIVPLRALLACICGNKKDCYGDDETSYYNSNRLSCKTHLNDRSSLTVHMDCPEIVYQSDR